MTPRAITLSRFLLQERGVFDAADDITELLGAIAAAVRRISHAAGRGRLLGAPGGAGRRNVQGEVQQALDLVANEILVRSVEGGGRLAALASEELPDVYSIPSFYSKGRYLLIFDPLDGSSNIEVNVAIGTIFSLLRCPEGVSAPTVGDFLQPGTRQVCAGYAIYGPSTVLVLTWGYGVNGFTLDRETGEFMLTHPAMQIAPDTQEFAINMSNKRFWEPPVQRYVQECVQGETGPRGKAFNMRWIASLVAEVHRILSRGGIFMYPHDSKAPPQPGRLRLLYEANPMAFIVEQAGGAVSTGYERMLDIQPTALHQRVPVILGARNEVERVAAYYREWRTA